MEEPSAPTATARVRRRAAIPRAVRPLYRAAGHAPAACTCADCRAPARQTTGGASEDASGARVGGSVNTPAVLLEVAAFLEPRFPRRAVCVRF